MRTVDTQCQRPRRVDDKVCARDDRALGARTTLLGCAHDNDLLDRGLSKQTVHDCFVTTDLSSSQKTKCPPGFEASQLGIKASMKDYLGSSGVGTHYYGLNTISSQLGIKSLGIRITYNSMLGTSITT